MSRIPQPWPQSLARTLRGALTQFLEIGPLVSIDSHGSGQLHYLRDSRTACRLYAPSLGGWSLKLHGQSGLGRSAPRWDDVQDG